MRRRNDDTTFSSDRLSSSSSSLGSHVDGDTEGRSDSVGDLSRDLAPEKDNLTKEFKRRLVHGGDDDPGEGNTPSTAALGQEFMDSTNMWDTMVAGEDGPVVNNPEAQREIGPVGLVLRQIRETRMQKWISLDTIPIENLDLLDEEDLAEEFDRLRSVALADLEAVFTVSSDLWNALFQKADETEKLQAELEEAEAQRRRDAATIRNLEDKLSANSALWQSKFRHALNELDATEKQLLERPAGSGGAGLQRTESEDDGETLEEARLENLRNITNLKAERTALRKQVTDLSEQLQAATERVAEYDEIKSQHLTLQDKYRELSNRFNQLEKGKNELVQELQNDKFKIETMQETIEDYERKLDETTRILEALRDAGTDIGNDVTQTLGTCLLNELLSGKDRSRNASGASSTVNKALAPIAEEPTELMRVAVSPVHLKSEKDALEAPTDATRKPSDLVRVEQIGNQVHIHIHQHHHAHSHQHVHNHDHFHNSPQSLKQTILTPTVVTPTVAKALVDRTRLLESPTVNKPDHIQESLQNNTDTILLTGTKTYAAESDTMYSSPEKIHSKGWGSALLAKSLGTHFRDKTTGELVPIDGTAISKPVDGSQEDTLRISHSGSPNISSEVDYAGNALLNAALAK